MTEPSALTIAANRARQRGYSSFDARLRTLVLAENEQQDYAVVDGLWLLIDMPTTLDLANASIRVSSPAGEWDLTQTALREMSQEHEGQVQVYNRGPGRQLLTVLEVVFQHDTGGLLI